MTSQEAWDKYSDYVDGDSNGISYREYVDICEENEDVPQYPLVDWDSDIDERAYLLARYLDIPYFSVERGYDYIYSIVDSNDEYYVLTRNEAYKKAFDFMRDDLDDYAYNGDLDSYVFDDDLWDWIYSEIESRIAGMSDEELIDAAIDWRVIDEDEVYEIDEEESLEQGRIIYKIRDDFDVSDSGIYGDVVNAVYGDIGDGIEWMYQNFGDNWIVDMDMWNYFDTKGFVEDMLDYNGVAFVLSIDDRELNLCANVESYIEGNITDYYGYKIQG